jgi:hypothetical protein
LQTKSQQYALAQKIRMQLVRKNSLYKYTHICKGTPADRVTDWLTENTYTHSASAVAACVLQKGIMSSYNIKFIISNYPQSTLEHNLRGVTIRALSPSVKKWNSLPLLATVCAKVRRPATLAFGICTESEWRHPLVPRESLSRAHSQKVLGSSRVVMGIPPRSSSHSVAAWKVAARAKNGRSQEPN